MKSFILLFALALFSACARAPLQKSSEFSLQGPAIQETPVSEEHLASAESYGPQEPYGPVAESTTEPTAPAAAENTPFVPPPEEKPREPKLCLVLGPGLAKGIAHAGVLEVFTKAKLPIACIVGTEMGAMVGAFYSQAKGSSNRLQWNLFKLQEENYFQFPLFSGKESKSSGKNLNSFFREIFSGERIQDFSIPFALVLSDAGSGQSVDFLEGNAADLLTASAAISPIFEPWKGLDGKSYLSGALSSPAPIELAKQMGATFVVLVNVLEGTGKDNNDERFRRAYVPIRNLMRLQKKEADFVVDVQAGSIAFNDFGRQAQALAAGIEAAENALPALEAKWNASLQSKEQPKSETPGTVSP